MFWKKFINRLFDLNGDGELDMVEQGAKAIYENTKALTAEEETFVVEVSQEGIELAQELSDPRKCESSKLKTVLRHPIRKTN